jgi:prophage regulatory protein
MSERLLRRPAVTAKTGFSTTEIYDQMKEGKFPRPVPVGIRAVAWLESEIDAHIAELKAKRDQGLMLPRFTPRRRRQTGDRASA